MLGVGAIAILDADFCLGMCGHISVRINETGKCYRLNHHMQGSTMQESDDGGVTWDKRSQSMRLEDFVRDYLPKDRWTTSTFVAAWAGFASGYERGRNQR